MDDLFSVKIGTGDALSNLADFGDDSYMPHGQTNAGDSSALHGSNFVSHLDDLFNGQTSRIEETSEWLKQQHAVMAQKLEQQAQTLQQQRELIDAQAGQLQEHESVHEQIHEKILELIEFKHEMVDRVSTLETKDLSTEISEATKHLEEHMEGFREAEKMRQELELNQSVQRMMTRFQRGFFKEIFKCWHQSFRNRKSIQSLAQKTVLRMEHRTTAGAFLPWLKAARVDQTRKHQASLDAELKEMSQKLLAQQQKASEDVMQQVQQTDVRLKEGQQKQQQETELQSKLVEEGASVSQGLIEKLEQMKSEQESQLERIAAEKMEYERDKRSRAAAKIVRMIANRLRGNQLGTIFDMWAHMLDGKRQKQKSDWATAKIVKMISNRLRGNLVGTIFGTWANMTDGKRQAREDAARAEELASAAKSAELKMLDDKTATEERAREDAARAEELTAAIKSAADLQDRLKLLEDDKFGESDAADLQDRLKVLEDDKFGETQTVHEVRGSA
jgi:hypothetical protein